MSANTKKVLVWVLLAFFLVALADFYPRVAIWVTVLLLADVLLINSQSYINLGTTVQKAIGA